MRPLTRLASPLIALALIGLVAGCTSPSSSDSADSSTASEAEVGSAGSAGAPELAGVASDDRAIQADVVVPTSREVISTGTVSLRAADVAQLLFDVQKAADQAAATVSERSSESDKEGSLVRSRLVLRVPATSFGDLMGALEGTGTLIASDSSSEDVTTQVVDTDVRVSVQKASIQRIQTLLAQAVDLKDVVAIEAELSSRQAELTSLEQTQAYLADQTALSTITVSLERTSTEPVPAESDEASGFLAGLSAGWHALSGAGTVVATVSGAILPWAVVAVLLGGPGLLLARRLRRRTSPASTGQTSAT